jgi:hypothetical protein
LSDLRTRIIAALEKHAAAEYSWGVDGCQCGAETEDRQAQHQADAVIAELDLENRITSAICGYAGAEQMALTHHDPNKGGTEFDALTRLISEAPKIAQYAMKYRRPDETA